MVPVLLDLLESIQDMALKVQLHKLGVVLIKPVRENLHDVPLKDVEQVHGLDSPKTSVDPPKDPFPALSVNSLFNALWKAESALGLVASWLMNKHGPKGCQDKEPHAPSYVRYQSIMSFQGDLDLDCAKLVDKLEERHDQELDHKVSEVVTKDDRCVRPAILDEDNDLVVVGVEVVKEELWRKEKEEDRQVLDQLCDPGVNSPMQWPAANVTLHHGIPFSTVPLSFFLHVLVDLFLFPIKVAFIDVDRVVFR